MARHPEERTRRPRKPLSLYVEDLLIFASVVGLFVFGVYPKPPGSGVALNVVLGVMVVVFVVRMVRTHRAFTKRDDEDEE